MAKANPMRGEADLGGHKLVVTFNGWCALEVATGKKVPQLLKAMKDGLGFDEIRTWVGVFLADNLPEDEVGDLIGCDIQAALVALNNAIEGFFAPREEQPARPRKAA